MIFVTVGNTAFDSLIKEVDKIKKDIIIQKANGKYIPKNHKYFDFGDLDKYFEKSDIIITHGGAGNIFRLLSKNKKIIAVANLERDDKHQTDLLSKLSSENYIIWCKKLEDIGKDIRNAKKIKLREYTSPECKINEKIKEFLK